MTIRTGSSEASSSLSLLPKNKRKNNRRCSGTPAWFSSSIATVVRGASSWSEIVFILQASFAPTRPTGEPTGYLRLFKVITVGIIWFYIKIVIHQYASLATVGLRRHPSPPHHHCGFLSLPVSGSVSDPANYIHLSVIHQYAKHGTTKDRRTVLHTSLEGTVAKWHIPPPPPPPSTARQPPRCLIG